MLGQNCILFAYGMTNAGKTYTIQGTDENPGIFPKLINAILDRISNSNGVHTHNTCHSLSTSMLEIYHEKIYDLLSLKDGNRRDKLNIRDGNGKVEVLKLSSHPIHSVQEATRLIHTASDRRYELSIICAFRLDLSGNCI